MLLSKFGRRVVCRKHPIKQSLFHPCCHIFSSHLYVRKLFQMKKISRITFLKRTTALTILICSASIGFSQAKTGYAQVNGYRGETKQVIQMEKRVIYDRKYIEKWSLVWDLKIIWLTLFGKDVSKNAF